VLLERLRLAEAVADLVPQAYVYLYHAPPGLWEVQTDTVKMGCSAKTLDLLVALREYIGART
jgi:succinate dehydrogenase hydrophobic anchor subunit